MSTETIISLVLTTGIEKNSVEGFQLSKTYIKRFLKIGTLNIIYRRIDIPDSNFELKIYESVPYMIFKRKSSNKFIRNYHVFTLGILDAVEREYLKEIFMYIRDKDGEIFEMYNFKIKYNKETEKSDIKPKQVRSATIEFLQALADIPGKKWTSDQVDLFMEFSYYADTPHEYEPPNFEAAKEPLCINVQSNKVVKLGSVNTGFHKVSAWGYGRNFSESEASTSAILSFAEKVDLVASSENSENASESNDKENKKIKVRQNDEEEINERKKSKYDDKSDSIMLTNITDDTNLDNITIISSDEYVTCLCNWELSNQFETIRCTKCCSIVHLVCHGYLTLSAVNETSFLCALCSSDRTINEDSVKMLMKLRIILYGIYLEKRLPSQLHSVTKQDQSYIMCQLDKLGVYGSKTKGIHDINLNKLNEALLSAFFIDNVQNLD